MELFYVRFKPSAVVVTGKLRTASPARASVRILQQNPHGRELRPAFTKAGTMPKEMWQALLLRLQLCRLRATSKARRGYRRSIVFVATSILLLILWRKITVAPRNKFIRAVDVMTLTEPTSILHPKTLVHASLDPGIVFSSRSVVSRFTEYSESFPQYGKAEPGQHYRIENTQFLAQDGNRDSDALLLISVFNDGKSWGTNRTVADFFSLVGSMNYPKEKMSITLLTSSGMDFEGVKSVFNDHIHQYAQLSVVFRNDFASEGLTRENRHNDDLQASRRRMLARYRNYALLLTLQSWHQHVVWLDADVASIPPGLFSKMTQSGLEIIHPLVASKFGDGGWDVYDRNAWVGHRKVRPPLSTGFVPGPLSTRNMLDLYTKTEAIVPLDSVGGAMLYVRADVHRQGVIFPTNYVIGSEWGAEGYDGIETEGICYTAHFLGFRCWGMPKEIVYHCE